MIYSEQSDDILVGLTLVGDDGAYEALVLRYQKAVLASAYSVIQNSYMAEDAAQDAFVSAWMKLSALREPAKYGAWVCRIAKNCAKNMQSKVREYADIDTVSRYEAVFAPTSQGVNDELHDSLCRLPEKIKRVIYLHYFEGLSIAEIAEKMLVPAGTVKWQLHEGRRIIRKDMDAVNEHENDALVERVMKKVRELKNMGLNNDLSGIEAAYRALLPEVEGLPDSEKQQYALAGVLEVGWWYVRGVQSDDYLARLRDAAERGHNDDVMQTVIATENNKLSGEAKIDFIKNHQIPRLERDGWHLSLGNAWFWLACEYFRNGDIENGTYANDRVLEILEPEDVYYANAVSVKKTTSKMRDSVGNLPKNRYRFNSYAEAYLIDENKNLRREAQPGYTVGEYYHCNTTPEYVFYMAGLCDGYLPPHGLNIGETYTATNGTQMTFESDGVAVETPCQTFENCKSFFIRSVRAGENVRTYFKDGVGIVRQDICGSETTKALLCDYSVRGEGILPFEVGNRWEYSYEKNTEHEESGVTFEIVANNGKKATVACNGYRIKYGYDENSFKEMMLQMRREYWRADDENDDIEHLCDVSYQMERAAALAKTPLELAHTKAACSVMKRILETDGEFNPNRTEAGIWNFFERFKIGRENGVTTILDDREYSFEWKDTDTWNDSSFALLYNDIYEMLSDSLHDRLWYDDIKIGTSDKIEWTDGQDKYCTHLVCTDGGSVKTAAGEFSDCIKLILDIEGMTGGIKYRGGHREYFIAPGVGIVRVVNPYPHKGEVSAIYELTEYRGVGEGYMPFPDGMFRRFDCVNLANGYVAWSEYTVCENYMFSDRAGVHRLK